MAMNNNNFDDYPSDDNYDNNNYNNYDDEGLPVETAEELIDGNGIERGSKPEPTRLFVGNVSWDTSNEDLINHLSEAGTVVFADLFRRDDGRSKGCAIVEYASVEDANNALETLHESELDGRTIFLREDHGNVKKPRKRRNRRKRGGGNGGNGGGNGGNNNNNNEPAEPYTGERLNRQLFVGNLPFSSTWEALRDAFVDGGIGTEEVTIQTDNRGRSKGFALVLCDSADEAERAIDMFHESDFEGRPLLVRLDRSTSSH